MKTLLIAPLALIAAISVPAQDDRELSTPTAWSWYYGQTAADIDAKVAMGNRLVDIEVQQTSPLRYSAAFVSNSGDYAKSWWYYYNISSTQLSTFLSSNNARLIDLEAYDNGSGVTRFAAVMVSNTGPDAKSWWYYFGTTTAFISQKVGDNNARLVDLDRYTVGGTDYYLGVMISNTGQDARSWWWYLNVSSAFVSQKLAENGARLYDLERRASGTYDVVMIGGQSEHWWWYFGQSEAQLNSVIGQTGSRIIDIETYLFLGQRRFAAVLLNNSNDLTTRVGDILRNGTDGVSGLYLKRVNGPVLANLQEHFAFEPASSIKVLMHGHAMKMVETGFSNLTDQLTVWTGLNGSCPQPGIGPVIEDLETVLTKMMVNSDNNRTMAVQDHYGVPALNFTAAILGMNKTSLNHTIGCGGPALISPNTTALSDLGKLHEHVANGWLGSQKQKFYDIMANSLTSYSDGLLNALINEEAQNLGMPDWVRDDFKSYISMAYKGGSYGLNDGTKYRSRFAWIKLPRKSRGVITFREYVSGAFVHKATDGNAAALARDEALAEMMRDEVIDALIAWNVHPLGSFTSFGSGCAGSNGVPSHTMTGIPEVGNQINFMIDNAPSNAMVVLHLGLDKSEFQGVPLPYDMGQIGAPGCEVLVGPEATEVLVVPEDGSWGTAMFLPNNPNFIGLNLHSQYFCVDVGTNALGVIGSNAVTTVLGGYN